MKDNLIIVTGKHAAAIDRERGHVLWQTKLPFSSAAPSVIVQDNQVFIGGSGKLCSLDSRTGALLWENPLPGMGYNFVNFALEGQAARSMASQAAVIAAQRAAAAGAAGAAGAAS